MAYLVKPTGAVDPQKRWLWEFPFWLGINDGFGSLQHRDYVEKALAAGFHLAGIDVGPSCASPAAAEVCQAFYEQLVSQHGLHKRARIMGQSHGGLIAYGWAFRHPECVDRIAGICPATDFRSWPGLPNVIAFPAKGLDYGISLGELDRRSGEFNPIDNLAPLAKAGAKILHIHGDQDKVVPTAAQLNRAGSAATGSSAADAEIVLLSGLAAPREGAGVMTGRNCTNSELLVKVFCSPIDPHFRSSGSTSPRVSTRTSRLYVTSPPLSRARSCCLRGRRTRRRFR